MRSSIAIIMGFSIRITKTLIVILLFVSLCFGFGWTAAADDSVTSENRGVRVVIPITPEVRQIEIFDPEESAGLFVGVQKFDSREFNQVPFAVDDAIDLAHLFSIELQLLIPSKVALSLSGDPEKESSKDWLRVLKKRGAQVWPAEQTSVFKLVLQQSRLTGPKGILFVAIATHGLSDKGTDVLVTQDSLPEFITDTGIRIPVLIDVLSRSPSKRRLILLDACRERVKSNKREAEPSLDPKSAMGKAFHDAIARASGQVIIAASTLGGYAYDDHYRKNGVFSGALIEGLHGGAIPNDAGLITVKTLGEFVNKQVLNWIKDNQPAGAEKCNGITVNYEGPAANMPLAIHNDIYNAPKGYRARRDAALKKLHTTLKIKLKPEILSIIEAALAYETPDKFRTELVEEILRAGDDDRDVRIITDYITARISKEHIRKSQ